jgi:hypothetical protein
MRNKLLTLSAAVLTAVAVPVPVSAAPSTPSTPKSTSDRQAPITDPDHALGKNWRDSSDTIVTGAGDTDGYHLYIAHEKDAFAWRTLATLTSSDLDFGPWGGAVCVTGSGKYAVAVFAPKKAANDPKLALSGALAAVVNTTTGKIARVATGVQYAYFNPGCGPDDRVLLTRAAGDDRGQNTDLLTVDAAAGKVVRTRHIDAQLTNPAPAPDGDYGIVGTKLVKVGDDGKLTTVATPQGQTFGVRATAHNGIDMVSVDGKDAVAQRVKGGRISTTATGPRDKLDLYSLRGGKNALVGQARMSGTPAELTTIPEDRQVSAISGEGHLIAEEVYSQQTADSITQPLTNADPTHAGRVNLRLRPADATKPVTTAAVTTTDSAPTLDASLRVTQNVTAAATVVINPPSCAVRRNDTTVQPLQPSPDMVEWAVDNAVHNSLTNARPANYLKSGLPSYSPQGMFPLHSLTGGGTVPANLMLAILAQETNLSQASWHAVPGDTGNPLIASYYGSATIDTIDMGKTDCGYGIGQITTGMSVKDGTTVYSKNQQKAIAVDYAANIAAGLNILIDKRNQMAAEPSGATTQINDGDPKYLENWFLAVWAYNSGFYPYTTRSSNNGNYGVGWLNNPANNTYKANREGFLRATMADAETPNKWSYPERIMGWAETPQIKGSSQAYSYPTFGDNAPTFQRRDYNPPVTLKGVSLPDRYAFCSTAVNSCSQAQNGCPAVSSACWWHGLATIGNCEALTCTSEKLAYSTSAAEPDVKRIYARSCTRFNASKIPERDATKPWSMIYTLNNPNQYNLGCDDQMDSQDGKFTIRAGSPAGATNDAYYADVDLHQLGAGHQGHIWFTHGASGDALKKHRIVGTWTPDLALDAHETERFDVLVHLPSHGATWKNAQYILTRGTEDERMKVQDTCLVNQDNSVVGLGDDKWVYIGNFELGRGAKLQLPNDGAPTTDDVGYDAAVFVPTGDRNTGAKCSQTY